MNKAIPTAQQLKYMDLELGVFLHFGIRTFNEENRDWDMKPMNPDSFNPVELDCDKWIKDIKYAGGRYAIMTTKHHDGFALWPSAYTDFSVKASCWKNGCGDVVRDFTQACRKNGVMCGLYYSCSQFDAKSRGLAYCDFVIHQITELLTNYGKIDILWFDGCGSEGDTYDNDRILKTIYSLQPDIMVQGFGASFNRWIGNEWGLAPMINSNNIKNGNSEQFRPGECDCTVIRNGCENFWFYTESYNSCIRTPEEMIGLYYYSIGRGANLLVNLAPDRRGLLQENQVELLRSTSAEMNRRLVDCRIEPARSGKDGSTYWLEFDRQYLFDHIVLEENMLGGQKIKGFSVNTAMFGKVYHPGDSISVYRGFTVGHKQICVFPPIRANRIDILLESDGTEEAELKSVCACYTAGNQFIQI